MKKTQLTNIQLNSILESGKTANPFDEIGALYMEICPQADLELLRKIHDDVTAIFSGEYPGFVIGGVKYHDLRHTFSVVLATIRLFHGLYHEQTHLPDDIIFQGLLSAYFHDSGMLPQSSDNHQPNSNYSKNHEERSKSVLKRYLDFNFMPAHYDDNCNTLIEYTNLDWDPKDAKSNDPQLRLCGQVIGSADLLAQMSDRYYLESLPLLFHEHQDGGIDKHSSAIDLMRNTLEFHENVIKKRLEGTLGNLAPAMQTHFQKRWQIDRNLYLENITLNLNYLRKITKNCSMDLSCWGKFLRRNPPSADL